MAVNNFNLIRELLEFRDEDDFYFMQIIQRKKDKGPSNEKISGTNNNSRLIRAYYINNIDYFNQIEEEVKELCKIFNARASINLNRRSYEQLALQTLKKVSDQILNRDYSHTCNAYNSVCGKYSNEKANKKWIIDIDDPDRDCSDIIQFINHECKPEGRKYITTIPSKNGLHLITTPFDYQKFSQEFPGIDVQKQNPTNLYIP